MKKSFSSIFPKLLFYSVPVLLGAAVIFLQIMGLYEIWKLFSVVLVLLIGAFMLDKGNAWGCAFGIFFGIGLIISEIRAIPHRMNMGNAGAWIEPNFENVQWYIWHGGIVWGIIFTLFFVGCGIYVLVKNRKIKTK